MTGDGMMQTEEIGIVCADGYKLQGAFFKRQAEQGHLPVLLSPATGVPQSFYFKFCAWLSVQGYDVLVFDYRGIGKSLYGHVRDSDALLQHWGERDQAAALDWLLERTGQEQVLLLGHSAGGQMMGILPNYRRIARAVCVAGSTGYFNGMPGKMRVTAKVLMKGYLPLSVKLFKYGRAKAVGFGEDLPRGVALQWRDWCSKPGYIFNGLGKTIEQDFHQEIRFPITVLHATDDWIATAANVQDLLRLYPNAPRQAVALKPQAFGYPTIGHIDMFRSSRDKLWPIIEQALQGQERLLRASAA